MRSVIVGSELIECIVKQSEDLVPPSDHMDTAGKVDSSVHGTNGPIHISLEGYPVNIDQRIIGMTNLTPPVFDYVEDMNAGFPIGLGMAQITL